METQNTKGLANPDSAEGEDIPKEVCISWRWLAAEMSQTVMPGRPSMGSRIPSSGHLGKKTNEM
jgi:hypothetical protein